MANVWLPAEIYLAHLSDSGKGGTRVRGMPLGSATVGHHKTETECLEVCNKTYKAISPLARGEGSRDHQSCQAKETDVERERTEHTGKTVAGHLWELLPPQSARVCLGLSFCIIIPEGL